MLRLHRVNLPVAETSCAILSHALSWIFLLPYSALLESKRHLCFSISDTNKILKSGSSLMVAWHVTWWWQNCSKLRYADAVQVTSDTHATLRSHSALAPRQIAATAFGAARCVVGRSTWRLGRRVPRIRQSRNIYPLVSGLQAEARWVRKDEIYYLSQIYVVLPYSPAGDTLPNTRIVCVSAQRIQP
jgi:hypothetical protein